MTYEVVCAHFNWKNTLYISVPFFSGICRSIEPSFSLWNLSRNLEYTCKTIDSRSVVLKHSLKTENKSCTYHEPSASLKAEWPSNVGNDMKKSPGLFTVARSPSACGTPPPRQA